METLVTKLFKTRGSKQQKAFRKIKRLLTSALALGLLDMSRDFTLFVHEKNALLH